MVDAGVKLEPGALEESEKASQFVALLKPNHLKSPLRQVSGGGQPAGSRSDDAHRLRHLFRLLVGGW